MEGGLLVPDEDVLEAVLLEDLVVDVEDCPAGIAEHVFDTLFGQTAHDDLRARDLLVRARQLGATAHSPAAFKLVKAYADACTQRPPTDVLADLGPRVDGLLTDGYTPDQITAALDEWGGRGLAPSVLPSIAHQLANSSRGRAGRGVLSRHEIVAILGPIRPPDPPDDVTAEGHSAKVAWSKEHDPPWWDEQRRRAEAQLERERRRPA